MDAKTALEPNPSFGAFLKVVLTETQWFPSLPSNLLKGREKFSVRKLLEELNEKPFSEAILAPVRLFRYPGIALAITAFSLTNPSHIDYSQFDFWKDKPPEITYISSSLPDNILQARISKLAPQVFTRPDSDIEDSIPEYLKSFAQDPERIKNTLRWKNLVEQVVADKRLNIALKDRQNWVNHMLKIIFIESEGLPEASSGIAFGLTQLKASTADEIASQYQIQQYDIYKNAWDNVFLGTAHQLNLAKWYGPELAVWTHHLGMGNMNTALKTYLVSNLKLPISTADDLFNDSNILSQTIKKYNITPQVLLDSPAVTAKLKQIGAWGNTTWEYYPRYQAAGMSMRLENAA